MAADVFLRHSVSHWSVRDIAKFVSSIARGASCSFRSRSQAFCQCLWGIEVVEFLPAPYGSYHRFWMRWSFALSRRAQCTSSIPFRIFIVFWYICFSFLLHARTPNVGGIRRYRQHSRIPSNFEAQFPRVLAQIQAALQSILSLRMQVNFSSPEFTNCRTFGNFVMIFSATG